MSDLFVNRVADDKSACRGCLALRCELYDMREKQMEQDYRDLTGLPVIGGLLCSKCLQLVNEFKAFRIQCRNSDHILNVKIFSGHKLNNELLHEEKKFTKRLKKAHLSRSRILNVTCKSTRQLSITDVLQIKIPDENETSNCKNYFQFENFTKLENDTSDLDIKPENSQIENIFKLENHTTNFVTDFVSENPPEKVEKRSILESLLKFHDKENTEFHDVEIATCVNNSINTNDTNETVNVNAAFTDVVEEDNAEETNVDDRDNNYTEPFKQAEVESKKSKIENNKHEMCLYFIDIWKAVSKVKGDHYDMFDRLYKFSLNKERPEFPVNILFKKEMKSEVYNFIKFLELQKEIADYYNVDVELTSMSEEKSAMNKRKKALADDSDHCGLCCKKYITAATRDRHMKLAHNESFPFQCEICSCTFKREGQLMSHLFKFHCTKTKCRECGQKIGAFNLRAQWSEVHDHNERYHRRSLTTCEYCGRTFSEAKLCYYHVRHSHLAEINSVQCALCGDAYNGAQGLKVHIFRIHTEAVKCAKCNVFFVNKDAMAAHGTDSGECRQDMSGCPMCGAFFPTESLIKEHYDDTHAKYKCLKCKRTFIQYEAYKTHHYKMCSDAQILPKRSDDKTETIKKKRIYVKNTTPRKKNINNNSPKRKRIKHYEISTDSNRIYICDVCGKDYNVRALLLYHMRIHTGEKPHKCEHCGKGFRLPQILQKHIWTHTGERRFKCEICDKAFRQHNHLQKHLVWHTGEKKYGCDMCNKRYTSTTTLRHHIQTVHEGLAIPPRRRKQRKKERDSQL